MKIAVSSDGKDLESKVSEIFGRCNYFVLANVEGKKIVKTEALENISAKQPGGAGMAAAQAVVEEGANAVITGNIGPRALDVFRQFGVEVFKGSGPVKKALKKFLDNKLDKIK
ncbi:MAG: NifB/NifX family molybdenum-iron cluster-binding protein [Candidatus Micrarchaeota archaeon]